MILLGMAFFGGPLAGTSEARAGISVNLELALLVDVSGSISNADFNLQKQGYVNAFNDPVIQSAIESFASSGGIAVTVMYWSTAGEQAQVVPWTQITSAAQASAFASLINATSRQFSGLTAPGSALNVITGVTARNDITTFTENNFDGLRQIIDVSGDGEENSGADTSNARDAALARGIDQINGLAIGGTSLVNWYNNNIRGGTGSFVLQANSFSAFDAAVRTKIGRELAAPAVVPEPGTLASGLIGVAGAMLFIRRRTKAA